MGANRQKMQDEIKDLSYHLNQLKKNLKDCKSTNRLYNKMVVRRAILKKELKEQDNSNIVSFFKKLKPKKQKTLICDYFK